MMNILQYSISLLGLATLCNCERFLVQQTGSDLNLTCDSATEVIKWKANDVLLNDTRSSSHGSNKLTSVLQLTNLTSANEGLYQCLGGASDKVLKTFNLTIISISGEGFSLVDNVTVAALKCSVDNTDFSVSPLFWKRVGQLINSTTDEKYSVTGDSSSSTLEVLMPGEKDVGAYTCVVKIEADDKTSEFEKTFGINTPPKVQPIDKLRSKVEGEKATIVCNVTGFPMPHITWYRQLEDTDEMKMVTYDTMVNATAKDGVPNAALIITDLTIKRDRGDYMCVATNFLGSDNATVTLKVKDKLAAVWPFLGICVEVAILCSIIFIFEKRRNRRMEEEEEVDAVKQDLMSKSNGTDDKELRQRTNATNPKA